MAASSSSSATGAPPSQDAIASLITQVSPTGQPARAPSRPVRPRQGQPKKPAATAAKKTATKTVSSTSAGESTSLPAGDGATSFADQGGQFAGDTGAGTIVGTEESAAGTSESTSNLVTDNQAMHPVAASEGTSTPPSTAQSSKQRPSSQDMTSTSPKLGQQQPQAAQKPKQLQKGPPPSSSASQAAMHKKKTKRKSWISSLFASCFTGGSGHDTEDEGGNTMTERKAGTANATRPTKTADPSTSTASNAPGQDSNQAVKKDVAVISLAKGNDKNDSTSKLTHPTESTAGTGTTSSRDISSSDHTGLGDTTTTGVPALPTSTTASSLLSPSPKPEIAPEVLAASQPGGTPLSRDETGDVLSGAVQAPGSEGLTPKKEKRRKSSSGERSTDGAGLLAAAGGGDTSRVSSLTSSQDSGDDEEEGEEEEAVEDSEEEEYIDEEERIIAQGGMGIPIDENGNPAPLLKELTPSYHGKKCLVLDLDETLVHSSFKLIHSPDFVVPVEIENQVHNVYVIKRPGVDDFMKRMGELYEVVVFTASLSKYADPVLDHLDIHHVVKHRLFRESCYNHRGNYVKDLSQLGREIGDTIIIDNSPASYIFHPNNAVPVSSWFNDPHDTELTDLQGFLADLAEVPDVRGVLDGGLFPVQ